MNPWLVAFGTLLATSLILGALIGSRILYDRRNQK